MTEPAVRSILTRARKALRKEYSARGGTLPVAGLAALAPWVTGLRWADRLRSAATRLAAPAAIGAMVLGLVGGVLNSPFTRGDTPAPSTAQAVVSQHVAAESLDRPSPALLRPVGSAAQRLGSGDSNSGSVRKVSIWRRSHITSTCTPSAPFPVAVGVGGTTCASGDKGSTFYVGAGLPANPTNVNNVGVETPFDCSQTPDTPVTKCQPSTQNPGAKS